MMYQRPMRQIQCKQNNNNGFFDLIVLGISLYSLWINTQNLQANRAQAYETQKVSKGLEEVNRELDTLNRSNLICRVKNQIEKENLHENN